MQHRLVILRIIVVIACAFILGRLVQLQIAEGARNRELADENRIRIIRRTAPRGNVYDRHTRILASSRAAFSVTVVPEELAFSGSQDPIAGLADLLGLPAVRVRERLDVEGPARYESILISRDTPEDAVARLEENSLYLSGVHVIADAVRSYPEKHLAAHVLGYVREISGEELTRPENASYRPLDLIGKAGVERQLEKTLRGVDGGDQIEVDAQGHRVRTLGTVRPLSGRNVWLTLDLDLQRAAETALGGRAGAVVAMDPWTGEILALASSPSYDPNLFVGALSPEDWKRLSGPGHPQHNRAAVSSYPPGSLFKIVTASAALEAGQTSVTDRFHCDGAFRIGGWALRCWKREGHGDLRFLQGFAQSCNVMFATLGRRVGPEQLAEMAQRFGLGRPCGIDLPEETAGLVPNPVWKREVRHESWYPGDTCQMRVGQGDCLVTPLQMARQIAAVANGGTLIKPHVLLRVEGEAEPRQPEVTGELGLRRATVSAIQSGMAAVVAPGGTASRIASKRYAIAGKTGTAQATGGEPHAWFGGYAPVQSPRLAVAVVVEHGGGGSATAAPIARYIFDTALLPPDERPTWQPPETAAPAQTEPAPLQ